MPLGLKEKLLLKILLVTANFETQQTNPWLLDDLAAEFSKQGHTVDVIVHSPTIPRPRGLQTHENDKITTFSVGTERVVKTPFGKLISYIATGLRLHMSGMRFARRGRYDLCLYSSIATFSYGFPSRVRRAGLAKALFFIMWDFFPIHQLEIGRIRDSPLSPALKHLEWRSIQAADVIATMSPANERFLRKYHPRVVAPIIHIPPWSTPRNGAINLPKRESFTAVFGGQLTKGRGVDTLLVAAQKLAECSVPIQILIAGDGPQRPQLATYAREHNLANVSFLGTLPREQYRQLLATAHVGIAITVDGVSPPSYPSKIVEYCASGLPVVACLEASSDAGRRLVEQEAGVAVSVGDSEHLARALTALADEHATGILSARGEAALQLFNDELSVAQAVKRITAAIPKAVSPHRNGSNS